MANVTAVPVFEDNYIWLIHSADEQHRVIIVDPGDEAPLLTLFKSRNITPDAILITHHCHDHINGIPGLLAHHDVPVYGPADQNLVNRPVGEGDTIILPGLPALKVLATPGHTLHHLVYLDESGHLFCGDTLFACGCGRIKGGGTVRQMYHSLQRLAGLPDSTQVFCSHEYTLGNLRFALAVEPDNPALNERMHQVSHQRSQGDMSLPSTIGMEKQTNPFLRCHLPEIRHAVEQHAGRALDSPEQVFSVLRFWKDTFA